MRKIALETLDFPYVKFEDAVDYESDTQINALKQQIAYYQPTVYFPKGSFAGAPSFPGSFYYFFAKPIKVDVNFRFKRFECVRFIIQNQDSAGGFYALDEKKAVHYLTPVFPGMCVYELDVYCFLNHTYQIFFFYYSKSYISVAKISLFELYYAPLTDTDNEVIKNHCSSFDNTHFITPFQKFELVLYKYPKKQPSIINLLENYTNSESEKLYFQFATILKVVPEAKRLMIFKNLSCPCELEEDLSISPNYRLDMESINEYFAGIQEGACVEHTAQHSGRASEWKFLTGKLESLADAYYMMALLPAQPIRLSRQYNNSVETSFSYFYHSIFYITVDYGTQVSFIDDEETAICAIVADEFSPDVIAFGERFLLLYPLHISDCVETVQIIVRNNELARGTWKIVVAKGQYRQTLVIKNMYFEYFKQLERENYIVVKSAVLLYNADYQNYENYIEWLLKLISQWRDYQIQKKKLLEQVYKIYREIWLLAPRFVAFSQFCRNIVFEVMILLHILRQIYQLPVHKMYDLWSLALFISNLLVYFLISYGKRSQREADTDVAIPITDVLTLLSEVLTKKYAKLSNFEIMILAYSNLSIDEVILFCNSVSEAMLNNVIAYREQKQISFWFIQVLFIIIYKAVSYTIFKRQKIDYRAFYTSFDYLIASIGKLNQKCSFKASDACGHHIRVFFHALIESVILNYNIERIAPAPVFTATDFVYFSDLYRELLVVFYYLAPQNPKSVLHFIFKGILGLAWYYRRYDRAASQTFGFCNLLLYFCKIIGQTKTHQLRDDSMYQNMVEEIVIMIADNVYKPQIVGNPALFFYYGLTLAIMIRYFGQMPKILAYFAENAAAFDSTMSALSVKIIIEALPFFGVYATAGCIQKLAYEIQTTLFCFLRLLINERRTQIRLRYNQVDLFCVFFENGSLISLCGQTMVTCGYKYNRNLLAMDVMRLSVYILSCNEKSHEKLFSYIQKRQLASVFETMYVSLHEKKLYNAAGAFLSRYYLRSALTESRVFYKLRLSYCYGRGHSNPDYKQFYYTARLRRGYLCEICEMVTFYEREQHITEASFALVFYLKQKHGNELKSFISKIYPRIESDPCRCGIITAECSMLVQLLGSLLAKMRAVRYFSAIPRDMLPPNLKCRPGRVFVPRYYLAVLGETKHIYSFDTGFDISAMRYYLYKHYTTTGMYLSSVQKLQGHQLNNTLMEQIRAALVSSVAFDIPLLAPFPGLESTAKHMHDGAQYFYNTKGNTMQISVSFEPFPNIDFKIPCITYQFALTDAQACGLEINSKIEDMEATLAERTGVSPDRLYCTIYGVCMPYVNAGIVKTLQRLIEQGENGEALLYLANRAVVLFARALELLSKMQESKSPKNEPLHALLVEEIYRQLGKVRYMFSDVYY